MLSKIIVTWIIIRVEVKCDGINTKNAQPDFIPSYENLIGINQI